MSEVSVYDAKTHLSQLIARAESGEEITITRHGRPVARLVASAPTAIARTPGRWRGRVHIAADFDQLSPQDLDDWYGE